MYVHAELDHAGLYQTELTQQEMGSSRTTSSLKKDTLLPNKDFL